MRRNKPWYHSSCIQKRMPLKPFNAGDTDCLSLLSAIGSKVICASLLAMRSHQTRTLFKHFKKHRLYHSHIYYQDKYITKIFFCQYFYIIIYFIFKFKSSICTLSKIYPAKIDGVNAILLCYYFTPPYL